MSADTGTLTVWGRATSSNVQKVMWTAAELGLDVTRIDAGGHHGGLDSADFRAMNPHGKVPAVRFGDGVTMFESNAIVRRLARADPRRRLWPEAAEEGARVEAWAEWAHNTPARAITDIFWAVERTRPSEWDRNRIAALVADAAAALDAASEPIGRTGFLCGAALSMADIVLGHNLYRWHTMRIVRPALPQIEAYYSRLVERPAFAQHVMVDYAGLRPVP